MAERTIVLHYHLFKNAGTSVDKILKNNFPDRWVTAEFPPRGGNNTALVERWIRDNPKAVAFSSHTMLGPIPEIEGVRVISVLLLRDPLERIRSAYRFERRQKSENFGAVLAKKTDFDGYVRVRLASPMDRQCRNFQTHRLASMMPGAAPEFDRAIAALERIDIVGLVEDFVGAMERLRSTLADSYPEFTYKETRQNRSDPGQEALAEENAALTTLLTEENRSDLALLEVARSRLNPLRETQ